MAIDAEFHPLVPRASLEDGAEAFGDAARENVV